MEKLLEKWAVERTPENYKQVNELIHLVNENERLARELQVAETKLKLVEEHKLEHFRLLKLRGVEIDVNTNFADKPKDCIMQIRAVQGSSLFYFKY